MRSLEKALQDHELIVLRVIGEWWELDLTGADKAASIKALARTLPELDLEQELLYLPPEEMAAMQALVAQGGRMPVATFSRRFGEVRLMGPGALEREEPWFDPISATEDLWYRGFIYRGFDETADGMVEFFYIPDELLALMPEVELEEEEEEGEAEEELYLDEEPAVSPTPRPRATAVVEIIAAKSPPDVYLPATTAVVDDMTTLLAMAQIGRLSDGQGERLQPYLYDPDLVRLSLLKTLAVEMGLLRQVGDSYRPARTAVSWLQKSRENQLRDLVEAWSQSAWNELRHVPELICEGSNWTNDPIAARSALLDALTLTDKWYAWADVLAYIKKHDPDFQRPNGNYETWYIRDAQSGQYLNGFASWELVEGRLLTYLLRGPLVWLGMSEVGEELFRLTSRALAWLKDEAAQDKDIAVPIVVNDDASLLVPFNADRYQRFQVARIAEPLPVTRDKPFAYRITPSSLKLAQEQQIAPDRVLQFLAKASNRPLPASTKRAIERWAEQGTEGRIEQVIVLRVKEREILDKLRQHPKTRPLIGESIGELAAVVAAEQWHELCQAAAQLGLLLELP